MKIQVRGGNCLSHSADVMLLFHHSDIRPLTGSVALLDWRCNAAVSILWKRKKDLFRFGQLTIVASQGKVPVETVILTGLGASKDLDKDMRREACRLALGAAIKVGAMDIAIDGASLAVGQGKEITDDLRSIIRDMEKPGKLKIALFQGNEGRQTVPDMEADEVV
jgi:hypothetical protein